MREEIERYLQDLWQDHASGAAVAETSGYGALQNLLNAAGRELVEELLAHLVRAISELEEQEQLVATFYFYEGLTLKEIGKALNLTEGRISQILRHALTKLRMRLKGPPLALGDWQENFG